MASRSGAMISGTDGNDYSNRETVVKQYHVSAKYKGRLKFVIGLHAILALIVAFVSLPDVLYKENKTLELYKPWIVVPRAQLWVLVWISSIIPSLYAWTACKRSNAQALKIFQFLIILLGALPIIIGINSKISEIDGVNAVLAAEKKELLHWMGYSQKLLWYIFFSTALLVQGLQLYISSVLINAWDRKKSN